MTAGRGEAQDAAQEGTESLPAKRDTQSPATGESHRQPLNSIEPPWYGPVCPVVWEGRSREAPPYPDLLGRKRSAELTVTAAPGFRPDATSRSIGRQPTSTDRRLAGPSTNPSWWPIRPH